MSAFKFACPVCGQHITCDSSGSGTQMACPTCFRKLVVPQAPASESQNFVLTAAEVPSRPTTTATGKVAESSAPAHPNNRSFAAIVGGVVLLAVLAGAGVLLVKKLKGRGAPETQKQSDTKAATNNPAPPPPATTATNWTLNLATATIPAAPVQGSIHGVEFNLDRAVIQGGKLDLRQGPKWPPDVGLTIHLFANNSTDLAGKTVVLESSRTNAPRVILRWKDEQGQAVTKDFRSGYAARVEFGPVTNNRLAGRIYLAAPDEFQSYVAGMFDAEIRKPSPPKQ